MSVTEIEAKIIKLAKEELAFENAGKRGKARQVMVEWCNLRDSLSGPEKERCIDLTVAVKVPMSAEALELLKERHPSAYSAYKDIEEFVS